MILLSQSANTHEFQNGAIGHRLFPQGSIFDKVTNCPIENTNLRRTFRASGSADTFFSVPGRCSINGKMVKGFLTMENGNPFFVPEKN